MVPVVPYREAVRVPPAIDPDVALVLVMLVMFFLFGLCLGLICNCR